MRLSNKSIDRTLTVNDSSNVLNIQFTQDESGYTELKVKFKSGHTYLYESVSFNTFCQIIISESVGSTLSSLIIRQNSKYPYKRLPS